MEYKFTFEDGSKAYLAHHGVKNMHWGVRNAETQRKYQTGNGGQVDLQKRKRKGSGKGGSSRLQSLNKQLTAVAKAASKKVKAKKKVQAKSKVKTALEKRGRVKKNLYIKGSHTEVLDNGKAKTTYY